MTDESRAASPTPAPTHTTTPVAAPSGAAPKAVPRLGAPAVIGSRIRKRTHIPTTTRGTELSSVLAAIQRLECKIEHQDKQMEAVTKDVSHIVHGLHR